MGAEEQFAYPEETVHYCATHPDVETGLSCNRCGKYICPRCMVQTPVGARCRDCGRVQKSPIYDVKPQQYAVATTVAILVGAVTGVAWAFMLGVIGWIFFLPWLLAAGVGYVIGEAVSVSANRRRGTGLAVIAALGVVVAYAVVVSVILGSSSRLTFSVYNIGFAVLFLAVAVYIAVNRVR